MIVLMDSGNIEYEPEVFPGLFCRISDPKIVFILFSSGKISNTCETNMDDVEKVWRFSRKKLSVAGHKKLENQKIL